MNSRLANCLTIHERLPLIDGILEGSRGALGPDFAAYKNHCYRVANFCLALSSEGDKEAGKIFVAAAFHDLGIWTHGTFDYLGPSCILAREHLRMIDKIPWTDDVIAMITFHHKFTPYRKNPELVESFRKADWIDVSRGTLHFGLRRSYVAKTLSTFPNAGFHKRLVQLTMERMKLHPFSPLPMMKW